MTATFSENLYNLLRGFDRRLVRLVISRAIHEVKTSYGISSIPHNSKSDVNSRTKNVTF